TVTCPSRPSTRRPSTGCWASWSRALSRCGATRLRLLPLLQPEALAVLLRDLGLHVAALIHPPGDHHVPPVRDLGLREVVPGEGVGLQGVLADHPQLGLPAAALLPAEAAVELEEAALLAHVPEDRDRDEDAVAPLGQGERLAARVLRDALDEEARPAALDALRADRRPGRRAVAADVLHRRLAGDPDGG